MSTEAATIVSVIRIQSESRFENDRSPLYLNYVDAELSDGTIATLFVGKRGQVTISDDELIGLTVDEAQALAEHRMPIL